MTAISSTSIDIVGKQAGFENLSGELDAFLECDTMEFVIGKEADASKGGKVADLGFSDVEGSRTSIGGANTFLFSPIDSNKKPSSPQAMDSLELSSPATSNEDDSDTSHSSSLSSSGFELGEFPVSENKWDDNLLGPRADEDSCGTFIDKYLTSPGLLDLSDVSGGMDLDGGMIPSTTWPMEEKQVCIDRQNARLQQLKAISTKEDRPSKKAPATNSKKPNVASIIKMKQQDVIKTLKVGKVSHSVKKAAMPSKKPLDSERVNLKKSTIKKEPSEETSTESTGNGKVSELLIHQQANASKFPKPTSHPKETLLIHQAQCKSGIRKLEAGKKPDFNSIGKIESTTSDDSSSLSGTVKMIGKYNPEQRKLRIQKFLEKRKRRVWRKKIKYDCRKKLADDRPRIKGRFVKCVETICMKDTTDASKAQQSGSTTKTSKVKTSSKASTNTRKDTTLPTGGKGAKSTSRKGTSVSSAMKRSGKSSSVTNKGVVRKTVTTNASAAAKRRKTSHVTATGVSIPGMATAAHGVNMSMYMAAATGQMPSFLYGYNHTGAPRFHGSSSSKVSAKNKKDSTTNATPAKQSKTASKVRIDAKGVQ